MMHQLPSKLAQALLDYSVAASSDRRKALMSAADRCKCANKKHLTPMTKIALCAVDQIIGLSDKKSSEYKSVFSAIGCAILTEIRRTDCSAKAHLRVIK